jgi:nucleoside-diphosphate-sugar epimerase
MNTNRISDQPNAGPLCAFARGKRILVTGSAGYLATNLIAHLNDTDCVIVRSYRPGTTLMPITGAAHVLDLPGDVRDPSVWERMLDGTDIVFHLAAQTSVYVANENPPADLQANVAPVLHLLETCRQHNWHPTVLFASTVTIAGIPRHLPVDEAHPDNPITVYDLHKLMAEHYLKWYASQGVVQVAILRLANVYGPGPKSHNPDRGILNQMIVRALAGRPLTIYRPGDLLRDYIYIEDVALAFLEAARFASETSGQHFIIASGHGHTLAQAIELVADRVELKTGKPVGVEYVDPPSALSPIESRNFVGNSSRFTHATGWHPRYSLAEGIDRTVEALL